jgi:hypothetical protein
LGGFIEIIIIIAVDAGEGEVGAFIVVDRFPY